MIRDIVLKYLKKNKDKYVKGYDIISFLQRTENTKINGKGLRDIIGILRLEGNAIVADNQGYMFTTSKMRLREYKETRMLEIELEIKRIKSMKVTGK